MYPAPIWGMGAGHWGQGWLEDLQLLEFIVGKAEFLWRGGGEWEGVMAPEVLLCHCVRRCNILSLGAKWSEE